MNETPIFDDEQKVLGHVKSLVDSAQRYLDQQEPDRELALSYYNGDMIDMVESGPAAVTGSEAATPSTRSTIESNDTRSTIKKLLPSIKRTILGSETIVSYEPQGPEDEEGAQQASDYVNIVVVPECGVKTAISDAIFDACLIKTGILKWSAYTDKKAIIETYTDQPEMAVIGLFDDPDNEVMDHEISEETDPMVLQMMPDAKRHSFKLKRIDESMKVKLEAIKRGSFLISPGAESIEEAELVGEVMITSRSSLVAMGYDKDAVYQIGTVNDDEEDDKESREGDDYSYEESSESRMATQDVVVYEVFCQLDSDDDGIAELHRWVFGEPGNTGDDDAIKGQGYVKLAHEIVSEAPYADVVIERDAHQFEGHAVFEDTRDPSRIKTQLLRSTMNNLYEQGQVGPWVQSGAIENINAVMESRFGEPKFIKRGVSPRDAVVWPEVPFFAKDAFDMLPYWDEVIEDRTQINDRSGGLDPTALNNVTATAAQIAQEPGLVMADEIVRTVAGGGVRKAFEGLLKLVIAHSDIPRTLRIRGEWVPLNSETWNTNMMANIAVGLGGGSRERDAQLLQVVLGIQKEIMLTLGADNPLVRPEQLFSTLDKLTEALGFTSSAPYFTKPDPEEVKAKMQAAAQKKSPEEMKLEADMQIEQQKAQAQIQREQAQLQADLQTAQAQMAAESQANAEKLAIEREKIASNERIQMAKLQQDYVQHQESLSVQMQTAATKTNGSAQ